MREVISTTSLVFIVIALGYVCVERSVFAKLDMEILGKYVINFALPALILQARLRKNCGNRFRKAFQAVNNGNQDVLNATVRAVQFFSGYEI